MSSDWTVLFRQFKEQLAQRLWAIPGVSESEKEMVYKEYLTDLDALERNIASLHDDVNTRQKSAQDENDLLRSLLGVPGDDLRSRTLTLSHEVSTLKKTQEELDAERTAMHGKLAQLEDENEFLRKRLLEMEKKQEGITLENHRIRQEDIAFYSDQQEALKAELRDLETRLGNLRALFADTNNTLISEKQTEITTLQKKLLSDMEAALRQKQELAWAEEEMFAKGVAHRVRAALVSAQGQLFLTLERLGLLDPTTRTEATWKARLRLLVEGGSALVENFRSLQAQFQEVTKTLDDYLHLTGRRELSNEPVKIKEIVDGVLAELYVDRRPTLNIRFFPEDPIPAVLGDQELLRFVVNTLVRNAVEALPGQSGEIEISLKNLSPKGLLQLFVKDTGVGIPAHLMPRLFQPFMTTKSGRQGLSLSRARRYMDLHGGVLELVESHAGGTTFKLEMPIARAA